MTLFFGYFTLQVPAGLTLYWVTSNLLQMLQQWAVPRFFMHPSTPAIAGASAGGNDTAPVTIDGKAEKAEKSASAPAKSTAVAKPAPATKPTKGKNKGK
jgi:YidC/Oxa1 family membrane protein insertase